MLSQHRPFNHEWALLLGVRAVGLKNQPCSKKLEGLPQPYEFHMFSYDFLTVPCCGSFFGFSRFLRCRCVSKRAAQQGFVVPKSTDLLGALLLMLVLVSVAAAGTGVAKAKSTNTSNFRDEIGIITCLTRDNCARSDPKPRTHTPKRKITDSPPRGLKTGHFFFMSVPIL